MTGITSLLKLSATRLLLLGTLLVCIGGLGDIAFHSLPAALDRTLEPLLGADGIRAHIMTLAGMLVALTGVIGRGLRR